MARKTALCERWHDYGTRNGYRARVTYRGRTLRHWANGADVWAVFPAPCGRPAEWAGVARDWAKRHGFTHIRFVGDFAHTDKPGGGRLA